MLKARQRNEAPAEKNAELASQKYARKSSLIKRAAILGAATVGTVAVFATFVSAQAQHKDIVTVNYTQVGYQYKDPSFKTNKLEYTLNAVRQDGVNWAGYEVNGRTNTGWWFQTGILYINKGQPGEDLQKGKFNLYYEVWDTKRSVFPKGGGSGLVPFKGTVNEGDQIRVTMTMDKSDKAAEKGITMLAEDTFTGAKATITITAPSQVGEFFQGSDGKDGRFTGLMTEFLSQKATIKRINVQEYQTIYPPNVAGEKIKFFQDKYAEHNPRGKTMDGTEKKETRMSVYADFQLPKVNAEAAGNSYWTNSSGMFTYVRKMSGSDIFITRNPSK